MTRPRSRARRAPALVTLTSDLGAAYAAQIKAVLARTLPPGHVVDLAHDLPAHRIAEAAFLLRSMAASFPPGTVHVAVIDPGVGGRRVPIVIRCRDGSYLVGPDNGVLAPLAETLGNPRAWRIGPSLASDPRVGATFDGRDLFAPTAARLALGASVDSIGPPHRFHRLQLAEAKRAPGGARGEIVHIDRFGNLITNIPSDWIPAGTTRLAVRWGRLRSRALPWVPVYERLSSHALGALPSSFGQVEIARREGRASSVGAPRAGTPIRVRWAGVLPRRQASVRG
ncbi:MAG: SAM-dependent chlorinase/fluorinase [Thermoplasmata archaeon]